MIMYRKNEPVVLVRELDKQRVVVRAGGGEEVVVYRNEITDTSDMQPQAAAAYDPQPVAAPGTGVDAQGNPFPGDQPSRSDLVEDRTTPATGVDASGHPFPSAVRGTTRPDE